MKPSQRAVLRSLALGASAPFLWTATAQVVLSPVAVPRTDLESFSPDIPLDRMINQSGITTPFTSGTTPFDTYFANPGQVFATNGDQGVNNWQSAVDFDLPLEGTLDFDLGARYRIHKVALWNQSLHEITLQVLDDLDGPAQTGGDFTLISRLSFVFSYAVDVLPFATPLDGRYLRLDIHSVHSFPGFNFGYATIGEIVVSATPVPEPTPEVHIAQTRGGDVQLQFTGTLQSASAPDAAFEDVPGNPQQSLTLPAGNLSGQQYFRSRIP
ncbi:MAG: hypothetical protein J0L84_05840 [Verrucomicrobia bacterium]|nr:hypothetical protein [Verrucomicrobiota bacterium]